MLGQLRVETKKNYARELPISGSLIPFDRNLDCKNTNLFITLCSKEGLINKRGFENDEGNFLIEGEITYLG